jgi:hypothetical protein
MFRGAGCWKSQLGQAGCSCGSVELGETPRQVDVASVDGFVGGEVLELTDIVSNFIEAEFE